MESVFERRNITRKKMGITLKDRELDRVEKEKADLSNESEKEES